MKEEDLMTDPPFAAADGGDDDGDGKGNGGGGFSGSRVKGPWSPEEDAVLSRLVSKFGARNWSLIARGIPGRSGKSCRLRWCNQLDPCVMRKPFTGKYYLISFLLFLFLLLFVCDSDLYETSLVRSAFFFVCVILI